MRNHFQTYKKYWVLWQLVFRINWHCFLEGKLNFFSSFLYYLQFIAKEEEDEIKKNVEHEESARGRMKTVGRGCKEEEEQEQEDGGIGKSGWREAQQHPSPTDTHEVDLGNSELPTHKLLIIQKSVIFFLSDAVYVLRSDFLASARRVL